MNIENHVLVGDHVSTRYIDCPKRGGAVTGPDTIIIHYTGGNGAESTADYLCSSSVKASAHLVIDRNSLQTFQLAPGSTSTRSALSWIMPGRWSRPDPATWRGSARAIQKKRPTEVDSEQSGRVTSPGLNLRSGPSARYSTVADPLEYNQALTILEEREGWYRIRASIELEGWVSSRHVELRREM